MPFSEAASPDESSPAGTRRAAKGLTHAMVATLTRQMGQGEFKPGDRLPTESELMARFGVSRGVVREALSRLQAAGRVQTHHGIGTFVMEAPADRPKAGAPVVDGIADMLDMLELRAGIETDAAGLAATRRGPAHLLEMRSALEDFERHLDVPGDSVSPDFRFHLAIAQATGNRYFADMLGQFGLAVIPRTRVSSSWLDPAQRARHLQKVNMEHQDILAAIERRDPDGARAAMRVHLVNSRERQRLAHSERQTP